MTRQFSSTIMIILLGTFVSCAVPAANILNRNSSTAAAASPKPSEAPSPEPAATPEKVEQVNLDPARLTRDFYEYYLDGFPSIDDNRVVYIQYLTSALFDRALSGEVDPYDPFFDAEDNDPTWKGNFTVGKAIITGNKATVPVTLNGQQYKWTIQVRLIKKGGVWKIDGVKRKE